MLGRRQYNVLKIIAATHKQKIACRTMRLTMAL
jgi:hypothetical protein